MVQKVVSILLLSYYFLGGKIKANKDRTVVIHEYTKTLNRAKTILSK